jgi:hypothetical protein
MVCPPATSEAGARWPRFGLVVATTTSRRDNKDQMIRPLKPLPLSRDMKQKNVMGVVAWGWGLFHLTRPLALGIKKTTVLGKPKYTQTLGFN